MGKLLWYAGLVLLVGGVTLSTVPTGSYSTIAGDRPLDLTVAGDDEALLALTERENTVTNPGKETAIADIENNFASAITVSYEARVDANVVSVETDSDTTTIPQGGEEPIYATCEPPEGGSGVATLTVTVREASAGDATVTDATLEAQFSYDCPGRPPGVGPPGGGDGSGNSGGNGRSGG